jgi:hypothetical protein
LGPFPSSLFASEPYSYATSEFTPNHSDRYVSELVDGGYTQWQQAQLQRGEKEARVDIKFGNVTESMITEVYGLPGIQWKAYVVGSVEVKESGMYIVK